MISLNAHDRVWPGLAASLVTLAVVSVAAAQPQAGWGGSPSTSRIVGIVVTLEDEPVVKYQGTLPGLPATSPLTAASARTGRGGQTVQAYRAHLARKQAAFEAAARAAVPAGRITHRFDVVLNGVAMRVTEDQIAQVAQLPGVKAVYRDRLLRLHTDTSTRFMGALPVWAKLHGHERAGEGVLVGVLDSGIWPEHPSFADPDPSGKRYPPPPTVPAQCSFGGGANPGPSFTCNNKLIGAYRFMATYDQCVADGDCVLGGDFTSARDSNGHGTHTASTAAGNANVESEIFGINRKHVSGVAPRAHLIAYKVCGPDGCFGSDTVAAIQQAILDGIDVINFSIGSGPDPYNDVAALAFLDAYAAGVFVAASAGNDGPRPNTAENRGPWVTTVAASTENRSFQTTLNLVAGDGAKLRLPAVSVTPGLSPARPVVVNGSDVFCDRPTPPDLAGKVVVCRRGGDTTRLEKSFNVAQRGAVAMILTNTEDGEELLTDNHSIPSVHIAKSSADALDQFLAGRSNVAASFLASVARNAEGDVLARFSSRGGIASGLGISKPDVTAPGVQILAANTPEPDDQVNPAGQLFQAIAGTSMSSPHVAGAAALLKHLHPEWTPGQIKSALMTTASRAVLVQEDGVTPFTPFDAGSGRVDLKAAQSPGITFDVPVSDYVDHATDLWTVNYPSVYLPDVAPDVLTLSRTPQSLAAGPTTWSLTVIPDPLPGLTVTVSPTVTIPAGGSAPFEIGINKTGVPRGEARHAILRLTSNQVTLHMPITAAGAVPRPDLIITDLVTQTQGTIGELFSSTATVRNVGSADATAFYFQVYLSPDDDVVSADDTPYWFCRFDGLAAGDAGTCDFTGPVPSSIPPGIYFLVVNADDGGDVTEGDENNNVTAAGPITIN
jgi:subtilisin family serine protease